MRKKTGGGGKRETKCTKEEMGSKPEHKGVREVQRISRKVREGEDRGRQKVEKQMKNSERQVGDEDIGLVRKQSNSKRERGNIGDVGIIHLEGTRVPFFFSSLPPSSSIIINSFRRPFIIVICSVQCALLAVLSGVGLCHQRLVP